MVAVTSSMDAKSVIVVPMDNLSRSERLSHYARLFVAVGVLVAMYFLSPPGFPRTYILVATGVVVVFILYSLTQEITRSELDFENNVVRQFRTYPILSRNRELSLKKFEIVTSSLNVGRSGVHWISVSLGGRNGSLEIARFGPDELVQDNDRCDHPEAKKLRALLAVRLTLRDVGVV